MLEQRVDQDWRRVERQMMQSLGARTRFELEKKLAEFCKSKGILCYLPLTEKRSAQR